MHIRSIGPSVYREVPSKSLSLRTQFHPLKAMTCIELFQPSLSSSIFPHIQLYDTFQYYMQNIKTNDNKRLNNLFIRICILYYLSNDQYSHVWFYRFAVIIQHIVNLVNANRNVSVIMITAIQHNLFNQPAGET